MNNSSTGEKDYTSRRGELSAFGRARNSTIALKWLIIAMTVLSVAIFAGALLFAGNNTVRSALYFGVIVVPVGSLLIWQYTKDHFIDPDLAFRKWLQQVCDGELKAGIGLAQSNRHFKELDFHTRNLTSSLRRLSTDMEGLVEMQTQRLENQNRVLELLFQLTSDVAADLDLQSVLNTVCNHLSGWLDQADVAAYMKEDNKLKLTAASGPTRGVFNVSGPITILPDDGAISSSSLATAGDHENKIIKIPIFKAKEIVGVVQIVASSIALGKAKESKRVFQTVSDQLSVFVLRDSALESAHNARLIRERTKLGEDLHDSLAQTLLATGYQVKMLRDTTVKNSDPGMIEDVQRIEEMINEANAEVRGLIGEYRKPLTEHRTAEAIRSTIDDFNRKSAVEVYFQLDDPTILFTAREDTIVQRIVGEALNNAHKYSNASMIRVYVRREATGARSVLIEDDGEGFCTDELHTSSDTPTGDHIGLTIMHDRAISIGALLTVESEIGDGTRVFLKLRPIELLRGE